MPTIMAHTTSHAPLELMVFALRQATEVTDEAARTEVTATVARTVIDCSVFYSAHILPGIHTRGAAISCGAGPAACSGGSDDKGASFK